MIIKRYYGGWHGIGPELARAEGGGVKSFIGWSRIEQELKKSGEIKEDEIIVMLDLNADGITYTVEKEADWGKESL